jgi:hypothetical protein
MKLEEIEGIERLATKDDLRILKQEMLTAIAEMKVDLLKWAIGMQLSFAVLILGALYALLTHYKA